MSLFRSCMLTLAATQNSPDDRRSLVDKPISACTAWTELTELYWEFTHVIQRLHRIGVTEESAGNMNIEPIKLNANMTSWKFRCDNVSVSSPWFDRLFFFNRRREQFAFHPCSRRQLRAATLSLLTRPNGLYGAVIHGLTCFCITQKMCFE